jgi:hypothetical protein
VLQKEPDKPRQAPSCNDQQQHGPGNPCPTCMQSHAHHVHQKPRHNLLFFLVWTLPPISGHNYNRCNLAGIQQPLLARLPDHTRNLREHFATNHVPTFLPAVEVILQSDANAQLSVSDMLSFGKKQLDHGPPDRCTLRCHPQAYNQHPGLRQT